MCYLPFTKQHRQRFKSLIHAINLPDKDKQFEFERFVNSLSETLNNAEHELSSLTIQRNHFIDTEIE